MDKAGNNKYNGHSEYTGWGTPGERLSNHEQAYVAQAGLATVDSSLGHVYAELGRRGLTRQVEQQPQAAQPEAQQPVSHAVTANVIDLASRRPAESQVQMVEQSAGGTEAQVLAAVQQALNPQQEGDLDAPQAA
jgi:hypothetical protein